MAENVKNTPFSTRPPRGHAAGGVCFIALNCFARVVKCQPDVSLQEERSKFRKGLVVGERRFERSSFTNHFQLCITWQIWEMPLPSGGKSPPPQLGHLDPPLKKFIFSLMWVVAAKSLRTFILYCIFYLQASFVFFVYFFLLFRFFSIFLAVVHAF